MHAFTRNMCKVTAYLTGKMTVYLSVTCPILRESKTFVVLLQRYYRCRSQTWAHMQALSAQLVTLKSFLIIHSSRWSMPYQSFLNNPELLMLLLMQVKEAQAKVKAAVSKLKNRIKRLLKMDKKTGSSDTDVQDSSVAADCDGHLRWAFFVVASNISAWRLVNNPEFTVLKARSTWRLECSSFFWSMHAWSVSR